MPTTRKNFAGGDPIITDKARKALSIFIELVDIKQLNISVRKLLLYYLQHEVDMDDYAQVFFEHGSYLFELLDELEEEYGN